MTSPPLTLALPDELLEELAHRVADLLEQRGHGAPPAVDGWLRGAEAIAEYIGAPASRVYGLSSAKRIPVEHDGSALIARRSQLDAWLRDGGGKRP